MYTYKVPKHKQKASWHESELIKPAVALGRDFCLDTSMHGFRHVAEPRRHWAERLLWVAATGLAIWGAVNVSLGQLQRYNESPTVVTLEKDFRSWQFSLPAVTFCLKNRTDPSKLEPVIKKLWDVEPSDEKYEYYKRFVNTVTDSDLLHLEKYQEFKDDADLNVDLYQLAVDVMINVDIKITVEGASLNWIPVMTEAGVCYSVNSLAIDDVVLRKISPNDTMMYPLTCKYGGSSCYIMLEGHDYYDFYYHSPYDILDIAEPATNVHTGYIRSMEVSVLETRCGKGIKDLTPLRRACLFNDEPTEKNRKVYSTNSCRLSCRSKLAMKLCKCIPFYYFYESGPQCSPVGMACLSNYTQILKSIGGSNFQCPCSAQCLYTVFRKISSYDQIFKDSGPFSMQGSMKYIVQPPKIRYTKEIVFHFQDLVGRKRFNCHVIADWLVLCDYNKKLQDSSIYAVHRLDIRVLHTAPVSFGGAAGLFLGASFISFVEIIYFLLEKVLKAVSIEDAQKVKKEIRKPTFEEHRMLELTNILERNRWNQMERSRNNYF